MRRSLVYAVLLVCCFALQASAQRKKVLAPHRPIAPRVEKPMKRVRPSTRRSMVGGLWMTDANFKSSIYLRNGVETDPVIATPILHLSNGTKYTLSDVTVEPAGIAIININDELQKQGISSWATLSGYVELEYAWPWDPFCATVRNVDTIHSLIFTYSLRPASPPTVQPRNAKPPISTAVIEGMWWKHEKNVMAFVSVANLAAQPAQTRIEVTDSEGTVIARHDITVSPRGMKLVNLTELQSSASITGGLVVTSSQPMNQLIVNGSLEDAEVGYSATIPFTAGEKPTLPQPPESVIAQLGVMTERPIP